MGKLECVFGFVGMANPFVSVALLAGEGMIAALCMGGMDMFARFDSADRRSGGLSMDSMQWPFAKLRSDNSIKQHQMTLASLAMMAKQQNQQLSPLPPVFKQLSEMGAVFHLATATKT